MFTILSDSIHTATGVIPTDTTRQDAHHYQVLDKPNKHSRKQSTADRRLTDLFGFKR